MNKINLSTTLFDVRTHKRLLKGLLYDSSKTAMRTGDWLSVCVCACVWERFSGIVEFYDGWMNERTDGRTFRCIATCQAWSERVPANWLPACLNGCWLLWNDEQCWQQLSNATYDNGCWELMLLQQLNARSEMSNTGCCHCYDCNLCNGLCWQRTFKCLQVFSLRKPLAWQITLSAHSLSPFSQQ